MENIIKKIIGKKSDDENENESNDDEFNELSKEELNEILSEYIKLEKFLGVNLDDYLQGHKDVGDIQEKIIELFKQQKIMCCNDFFSFYCYTRGKTKDELKNRIHFLGINEWRQKLLNKMIEKFGPHPAPGILPTKKKNI